LPLHKVEELTENIGKRTALEIKSKDAYGVSTTIANLKEVLGDNYRVLSREEQHSYIYKAIRVEKLMALIIISALLILASFTTFLTLSMLVLSKEKDIAYLMSMGASKMLVTKIYIFIGAIIGAIGTLMGILIGGSICLLQEKYGFIGMGVDSALVDAYPVKLIMSDITFVAVISFSISLLISLKPAYQSYNINIKENI
jgi:lipoprotein-releasing system permease protein